MSQPLRSALAAFVALATCALLVGIEFSGRVTSAAVARSEERLIAEGRTRWYRGNLHTHSLWSDGDDFPEMIALWYKEHDYDFLCFTDHNVLPANEKQWFSIPKGARPQKAIEKLKARFPDGWIEERTADGKPQIRLKTLTEVRNRIAEPGRFLLMQGEEISDMFGGLPIHLNASNVQEAIPPMRGTSVADTIQNNVNAVIAQRERTKHPILVHLNHPNFYYGVTAEDLMGIRGEKFFEVYNGHPQVHNAGDAAHASTDRIWDILLAHRIAELRLPVMYALATDDGHDYHSRRESPDVPSKNAEPGRGWTMVLAPELSPEALIAAMEAGRFYSTSGVRLREVVSSSAGLDVEVDAETGVQYTIDFIGTRQGFDRKSEPVTDSAGKEIRATRRYSDDVGMTFQTVRGNRAAYRFGKDDLYVRARVTSTKKHPNPAEVGEFERAWIQPVLGPAAPTP